MTLKELKSLKKDDIIYFLYYQQDNLIVREGKFDSKIKMPSTTFVILRIPETIALPYKKCICN